jgi:hypothetical protein
MCCKGLRALLKSLSVLGSITLENLTLAEFWKTTSLPLLLNVMLEVLWVAYSKLVKVGDSSFLQLTL